MLGGVNFARRRGGDFECDSNFVISKMILTIWGFQNGKTLEDQSVGLEVTETLLGGAKMFSRAALEIIIYGTEQLAHFVEPRVEVDCLCEH